MARLAKTMKLTRDEPDHDSEWFSPHSTTPMGLRYVDRDGDLVAITFNNRALLTSFGECSGPATHRVENYSGEIREIREGETFTLGRN
jgi:hypothetical protein